MRQLRADDCHIHLLTGLAKHVYCYFWAYLFSTFSFLCFYTFQLSVSVWQIKLTHVGFRAHVKITSRIVSYRIITFLTHQHKAAGRKTRLDIQNYGCNGNLLCYHGVVERNRISSLQSHGKALEKECCLPGVFCDSGDTPANYYNSF